MNTKNTIITMILFTVIILTVIQVKIQRHEDTHKAIYEQFGYNATINMGFLHGTTNSTVNNTDLKEIGSLQSIVELVSYQDDIVFVVIAISAFVFLMLFEILTDGIKTIIKLEVENYEGKENH